MKYCEKCKNFFPDDLEQCPVDSNDLTEPGDEFIGKLIGGCYRILSKLAEGGVGNVYFAKHLYLDRHVAIKVLKPKHLLSEELRDRTLREARICGTIEHPNIVKVYDMVLKDRNVCVVMEYLEGETLKMRIHKEGKFDLARACRILSMAAEGLARAHSLDIVHRDIKPSNIFLTNYGNMADFVKLLDFGIAYTGRGDKLTEEGMLVGTPKYCPPEQIKGGRPVKASDIYSLGCVAYELITGRPPFSSKKLEDIIRGHLMREVDPPNLIRSDIPDRFNDIVVRMLEKNADDRYMDASELILTLKSEGYYDIESKKEKLTGKSEEVALLEETTSVNWGAYFKKVEVSDDEDTTRRRRYHEGIETAKELQDLELKTKEIIKEIEKLENQRRAHQENIAKAIEILNMDLSKLRVERRKTKMEYIQLMTRNDHLTAKLRIIKETLNQQLDEHKDSEEEELEGEELSILIEAGDVARELIELKPKIKTMVAMRSEYTEKMKKITYQITQLSNRLNEIEAECNVAYEAHRKKLDEMSKRSEALRKKAALAAYLVQSPA